MKLNGLLKLLGALAIDASEVGTWILVPRFEYFISKDVSYIKTKLQSSKCKQKPDATEA